MSPSAAIKLMQRVRATERSEPARIGGYRRPLLAGHDDLLRSLTQSKPGITLVELKACLAERGIEAGDLSTLWRTLRRIGLTHKKVAEGLRARSSRRGPRSVPLADLAALHGSGAVRVPGRDGRHHQDDEPLRLGPEGRAPG